MKNIIVLCGGRSTEHEIALRSARNIINGLDREKYRVRVVYVDHAGRFIDRGEMNVPVEKPEDLRAASTDSRAESIAKFVYLAGELENCLVFPVIHGQTGEDGEIQGFLQTIGLPYIGNGLTASALCMDKGFANGVLRAAGLPEARFYVLNHDEYEAADRERLADEIVSACGERMFVKPANNGSSIGVMRASRKNLFEALDNAFRYDRRVVVEEEIRGIELEISVLGTLNPDASLPGSYTTPREVLDYTAKYNDKTTIENVPYPLEPEKTKELQELALAAYRALGCEGFARVDIFMDEEEKFYINEINTFPGMTPSSLAPKLWTALTDMTFAQYLDRIIESAEESNAARASITTKWEDA